MRWRFSALLLPIAMLVSPARAAPRTITAAQAACDEQAGDFHREEGMAYLPGRRNSLRDSGDACASAQILFSAQIDQAQDLPISGHARRRRTDRPLLIDGRFPSWFPQPLEPCL